MPCARVYKVGRGLKPTTLHLRHAFHPFRRGSWRRAGRRMKFGKRLKKQMEETLPDWRDKFLSYKDLKRLLRRNSSQPGDAGACFIRLLNAEVDKFNAFYLEQEEGFVILLKELQDRIRGVKETVGPGGSRPSEADYEAEMAKNQKDIVDLHGEMVLLVNYSNINYTGLAKILKKHDKRTGCPLRLPFIEKVLKQPFFTTDLISRLVKECEDTINAFFPLDGEAAAAQGGTREALAAAERSVLRNAIAALITMRELRLGSSTYDHFSLPPLTVPDPDLSQPLQLASPIPSR